jgi:hypothetical protein
MSVVCGGSIEMGGVLPDVVDEVVPFCSPSSEVKEIGAGTFEDIQEECSVCMNGSLVNVDVFSDGYIDMVDVKVKGAVNASGSLIAVNSVAREFDAGGHLTVTHCLAQKLWAGGRVKVIKCKKIGRIDGFSDVKIKDCASVGVIECAGVIDIIKSNVIRYVLTGSNAKVSDSRIQGILTCTGRELVIKNSTVASIVFNLPEEDSDIRWKNLVRDPYSGAVDVYTVVPLKERINPGTRQGKEEHSRQIVKLYNSTVGNITFEGGNGEVVLQGESSISPVFIVGGNIKE